ncbi:unnamed protein product [Caretta caretta]
MEPYRIILLVLCSYPLVHDSLGSTLLSDLPVTMTRTCHFLVWKALHLYFSLEHGCHNSQDMLDHCVVTYLDDIPIYSDDQPIHDQHVYNILERLCQHGLCANLENCVFNQATLEFIGYILHAEGVCTDPWKVEVVRNWAMP